MEKTFVFGHQNPDTDSIVSSIIMTNFENMLGNSCKACRLGKLNKESEFILNYLKLEEPELITNLAENSNVILVDHNSFLQSAEGIEKANIIKVVDHHNIANFETAAPIFYRAEPVRMYSNSFI